MRSNLVLMKIEPGTKEESRLLEPKLSWVRLEAGKEVRFVSNLCIGYRVNNSSLWGSFGHKR
jgi:hypothetical protein